MKVLFVGNPSSRPTDGGGDTFQQALLAGLKGMRSSHECSYVQPTPGQGVVQSLVAERQIDLVWFMSPYYEPVEVPFATTVWDLGHRQMPYFPELSLSGWSFEQREQYYRHVLPRASIIAIGNRVGLRSICDYYQVNPANIFEIPLPVDAEIFETTVPDAAALQPFGLIPQQYLLYPAQFWPHKNHITLIDALVLLRSSGRHFKLVLTGSDKGNRGYVEQYVAQRGLKDAVVFAGFVDNALLRQLYINAFALVFASLLGPDNLPPLEAMALGCPVVCSAFEGAREQLGDAALYFSGLDAADAATQIVRLDDVQLRKRLNETGKSFVRARTPAEYIAKVNSVLDGFATIRRLWGPSNSYRHPT